MGFPFRAAVLLCCCVAVLLCCCVAVLLCCCADPGGYRTNMIRIVETLTDLKRTEEAKRWMLKLLGTQPSAMDDDETPKRIADLRKKLRM